MAATEAPAVEGTEEATTYGEPEVVNLTDEREAGYLTIEDSTTQGAFLAFPVSDDVVAIVMGATGPGEYTEELDAMVRDVAASVEYTGTTDQAGGPLWEMMQGMDTGTPEATQDASTGDTSSGSSLDGEALVNERCTVCHDRSRIDSKDKDEAGWTETVDRMISHGAQLNADERDAVIAYLVETH
jgi:cytochrome c5